MIERDDFREAVSGFAMWTICLKSGPCPCAAPCALVRDAHLANVAFAPAITGCNDAPLAHTH